MPHESKPKRKFVCSVRGSPGKERPRPANQRSSVLHKLPNMVPKCPFASYKESKPALTSQQMPNTTSLFLLTLLHKNVFPGVQRH